MIFYRQAPAAPLAEFVDHLWYFEDLEASHRMEIPPNDSRADWRQA
ncbi:MAG TPA: hypothetical protein VJS65_17045 [Verrucomicrobiae bacterium]|nr:hypothetical protein [Verrucomicrobiae bacterium]